VLLESLIGGIVFSLLGLVLAYLAITLDSGAKGARGLFTSHYNWTEDKAIFARIIMLLFSAVLLFVGFSSFLYLLLH
jgi:uncharacterized membrane protein